MENSGNGKIWKLKNLEMEKSGNGKISGHSLFKGFPYQEEHALLVSLAGELLQAALPHKLPPRLDQIVVANQVTLQLHQLHQVLLHAHWLAVIIILDFYWSDPERGHAEDTSSSPGSPARSLVSCNNYTGFLLVRI